MAGFAVRGTGPFVRVRGVDLDSPEPLELAVSTSTVYGFRWSTGLFALILVPVVLARLDECQRPGARLAK